MAKGCEYVVLVAFGLLLINLIVSFVLSYFVFEHVTYLLPYISDTGTLPPESCYFGQILNILWILVSLIVYIKYSQIRYIISKKAITSVDNLNTYGLITGLAFSFGMSIVANFQETNAMIIHWVGATMVFGFGAVYLCIMTAIYNSVVMYFNPRLFLLRLTLSVTALVSFVIFFVAGMVAYSMFNGQNFLHWTHEFHGYKTHLCSTTAEWICASSIGLYLLMYYWEFKQITIYEPIILFNTQELQSNIAISTPHEL